MVRFFDPNRLIAIGFSLIVTAAVVSILTTDSGLREFLQKSETRIESAPDGVSAPSTVSPPSSMPNNVVTGSISRKSTSQNSEDTAVKELDERIQLLERELARATKYRERVRLQHELITEYRIYSRKIEAEVASKDEKISNFEYKIFELQNNITALEEKLEKAQTKIGDGHIPTSQDLTGSLPKKGIFQGYLEIAGMYGSIFGGFPGIQAFAVFVLGVAVATSGFFIKIFRAIKERFKKHEAHS